MNKKILVFFILLFAGLCLASCNEKVETSGAYDFIIYESDANNGDLSDNKVVAKYHIEYDKCKTVTDTLIQKDSKYYFSNDSLDYLVMTSSVYGLSYTTGYFSNYFECADGNEIDVSWSYTTVNGSAATKGIGETPLDGLKEYGFIINGYKTN